MIIYAKAFTTARWFKRFCIYLSLHFFKILSFVIPGQRYEEAMQNFSVLKNRVIGWQITEPPVAKKQRENDEDDIDESVIDTLPEKQQVSAKKIMRVLRSHVNDLV